MRADPKLLLPIIGLFVAIPLYSLLGRTGPTGVAPGNDDPGATIVSEAMRSRESGFLVETSGVVEAITGTETTSLEQRFLVRLSPDVAVHVVHEVRAAVVPLAVGDRVRIRGRYEWTADGGFIGGTQDALDRDRPGGWVLHHGVFYPPHDGWTEINGTEHADE